MMSSEIQIPSVTNGDSSKFAPRTLKLLALNIAHGRGLAAHQLFLPSSKIRKNLGRIAALLRREEAEVVALQEVDALSVWNGSFHQLEFLAREAGFSSFVLGEHMRKLKLRYGTALLSDFLLSEPVSMKFANGVLLPPKGVVVSTLSIAGEPLIPVDIVSLHLDFLLRKNRARQAYELLDLLAARQRPCIVMGDFNCDWNERNSGLRTLVETLGLRVFSPEAKGLGTFRETQKRWDWIVVSKEFQFIDYKVVSERVSDHKAVVATVQWIGV